MKRKFLLSVIFSFLLFNLNAGGFGVSGIAVPGPDFCGGLRLDYAADTIPFVFTADLYFYDEGVKSALGGLEFLAGNINLFKAVNFFYAPEIAAGFDFSENKVIFENAFYLGFNGFCTSRLQLFMQGGWAPQLLFADSEVGLKLLNFPLRAGVRVWAK
ncbi:hypothetical protein [Treponema sp. C6A8]|uniref:hypothetical protein n=1 Tax=Treponema sp. C6A8 TaxID=1410609 RepID=UPI0012DCA655|nr:hypothetical protein [Treponema sp. C6A8]